MCQFKKINPWKYFLPEGLEKGFTLKYPEVSMLFFRMSLRMLFLQSSPAQLWQVALVLAADSDWSRNNGSIWAEMTAKQNIRLLFVTKHTLQPVSSCLYLLCFQHGRSLWSNWYLGICGLFPPSYCDCRNPSFSKKQETKSQLSSLMLN